MSVINSHEPGYYRNRRRAETREYWLLFCIAYPFGLAAAIGSRIVHFGDRRPAGASPERRRSVFVEAWATVAACIPFAFQ